MHVNVSCHTYEYRHGIVSVLTYADMMISADIRMIKSAYADTITLHGIVPTYMLDTMLGLYSYV